MKCVTTFCDLPLEKLHSQFFPPSYISLLCWFFQAEVNIQML